MVGSALGAGPACRFSLAVGDGSLGAWVGAVSSGPVLYAIGRRVPVVVWLTIAMKMTVSVRLWSGPPLGPPSSHLKQFLTLLGTLIVRRVYGTMGPLLRAFLSVVARGGQIGTFGGNAWPPSQTSPCKGF